jgi:phage gpG-like protein
MIIGTVTGDKEVEAKLRNLPQAIRIQLALEIKKQWFALQSHVVRSKLSGQVLRRVTGNLASSINVGGSQSASEFIDGGTGPIIGRVGTKVRYARIHEFGGTVTVKAHTRRFTKVFGREVDPGIANVAAYTMTMPERSFLRSSLADRDATIRAALRRAVGVALK